MIESKMQKSPKSLKSRTNKKQCDTKNKNENEKNISGQNTEKLTSKN